MIFLCQPFTNGILFRNVDTMSWHVRLPYDVFTLSLQLTEMLWIDYWIYYQKLNAPSDMSSQGACVTNWVTSMWSFGLPRAFQVLGFIRLPGAYVQIDAYFSIMLLLNVGKQGGIAQISLATRTTILPLSLTRSNLDPLITKFFLTHAKKLKQKNEAEKFKIIITNKPDLKLDSFTRTRFDEIGLNRL